MKGSDYALLGLTFVTGMMAGAFLYVTAFLPAQVAKETARDESSWTIGATMVGDCEREVGKICSRFELLSDRTYQYLPPGQTDANFTLDTSSISATQIGLLEVALTKSVNDSASTISCSDTFVGSGYEYDVRYEGDRFIFSTCDSAFAASVLNAELATIWRILAGDEVSAPPVLIEEGVSGWLENLLDESFRYNEN